MENDSFGMVVALGAAVVAVFALLRGGGMQDPNALILNGRRGAVFEGSTTGSSTPTSTYSSGSSGTGGLNISTAEALNRTSSALSEASQESFEETGEFTFLQGSGGSVGGSTGDPVSASQDLIAGSLRVSR